MRSFAPSFAFAAALVAAPAAAAPGTYTHEAIGFRLAVPSEYSEVPPQTTEPFVVARFLSKSQQHQRDPQTGYTRSYQPKIEVIAFLDAMIEGDSEEDEVEGGEVSVRWNPFPNYQEYLKGRYSGFYLLTDPEEGEEGGLPVEKFEVSVQDGAFRFMTWVYTLDVGKVAVQVDMLESYYEKEKRNYLRVLRSMKAVPRTKDLSTILERAKFVSFFFLDELGPEEREMRLREMEREAWQQVTATLPDEWKVLEHKGVPIVTHADDRHAKEVAEHVAGVRKWLEDTFPDVGKGSYTRMPIVRICQDPTEESTFRQGLPDFFGRVNEIVTHKSTSGATSSEWEYVNQQTMSKWFSERDSDVWLALPPWLSFGLRELVGTARPKGSKLEFPERSFERDLKRHAKDGNLTPIRELMELPESEFYGDSERVWARVGEALALTRFLLTGAASKSSSTKDFFPTYMKNLGEVVAEFEKEELERLKKDGVKKPENEEEEAELQRKRRERAEQNREAILREANKRTFGSWAEADWSRFESAYQKSY